MWAYHYADALSVGRAIEELEFFWYEDPLVEEDVYNYTKLLAKLDLPVMSTEFAPGRFYGMASWITQCATDILRGDVAVTGGITPLLRLCHLAEGFRMKCEIHHGGNSLNNVANLHVTMRCRIAIITRSSRAPAQICTGWSKTSRLTIKEWSTPRRSPGLGTRSIGIWSSGSTWVRLNDYEDRTYIQVVEMAFNLANTCIDRYAEEPPTDAEIWK